MHNFNWKAHISISKPLYFLVFFVLFTSNLSAQVGIAIIGSYAHPGLSKSEKNDIRFEPGAGYGFSIRHGLYQMEEHDIDVRYSAVLETHRANLQLGENAKYHFSNFAIDLIYLNSIDEGSNFYGGLAINFLSASSKGKFRATYIDNTFYPSFIAGYSSVWAEGFDYFVELNVASGGIAATEDGEKIPINGFAFRTGITMYISEK